MVISDFESWTYLFAKAHNLPIISVDNMQVINRCSHEDDIIGNNRADFELARAFVKASCLFAIII